MIRDHELTLFQKIIICSLAGMAILFAILMTVGRNQEFVRFEQMEMRIAVDGNRTVYTAKKYGEEVTVVCFEEKGADIVDFTVGDRYHDLCRVEYPEGTITTEYGGEIPRLQIFRNDRLIFDGGYDPRISGEPGRYFDKDGKMTFLLSVRGYTDIDPWQGYEFSEGNILFFANDPAPEHRGSWGLYLLCTVLAAFTAVTTALPDTLFYLNHRWYVRDPEPTDFYYTTHAVSSFLLSCMVLILYIAAFRILE